jgi:hypothetical protein
MTTMSVGSVVGVAAERLYQLKRYTTSRSEP